MAESDRVGTGAQTQTGVSAQEWRYPRARLQIFSRAPAAGVSKTRLIPALGAHGAAALQAGMTRHTVSRAVRARLAPVELWGAPRGGHPWFAGLARTYPVELRDQPCGDLGLRMDLALSAALRVADAALLIGCDCPAMDATHWDACLAALSAGRDAVLLPAEDGGYVAVGLRRPAPWLFANIEWGTVNVIHQTRERLRARGWSWAEPAQLWDVDEPQDWLRMKREFPGFSRSAS